MSEYRYKVELVEIIPENIPLKQVGEIVTKKEWYGHSFGDVVGRVYDDGRIESFFKHDGDGSEWFDILRENQILKSKHRYLINRETREEYGCEEYYLMRKVVDHLSCKQSVADNCLDTCVNVDYEYTYEILIVGDEEYKRYIYRTVKTSGPYTYCLLDEIENLEELIEEWAEKQEMGFSYDDEGGLTCKMYDDFGEEINAEYASIRELMMHVNSIRLVDLKNTIVDRQN